MPTGSAKRSPRGFDPLKALRDQDSPPPKVVMWDIETTDLKSDWGEMLCYAIKPLGQEPYSVSVMDFPKAFGRDPLDDRHVVRRCVKDLVEADVVVSWYGWKFDRRFLNGRCAAHGIDPIPPAHSHVDLWRTSRFELALSSNRLAVVQEHLGLPEEKTPLKRQLWKKAKRGHRQSLKYVVEHCLADVVVLEQAYRILLPYVRSHPGIGLLLGDPHACPRCGAGQEYVKRVAKRHYTPTRVYPMAKCGNCGGWSRFRAADKLERPAELRG